MRGLGLEFERDRNSKSLPISADAMSAKYDCEELMNSILPVAQQMLSEYREFYPYGGYMKIEGDIIHVGAKDPTTDHPKSQDLLDILQSSFQELASDKKLRAAAIVCDVRIKGSGPHPNSDAIQVSLEHVDGYSVRVLFPYSFVNGEVVYGERFAWEGEHQIFGHEGCSEDS